MSRDPAEIIAKLGELEPDEIARLFNDEQVVGLAYRADVCPVSRYVSREAGGSRTILVGHGSWHEYVHGVRGGAHGVLPENVKQFVRNFDAGKYPHLDEGEPE